MFFIRRPGLLTLCTVLATGILAQHAWAQTALSEIVGDVSDATGTGIARVAVKLTNEATGVETVLTTNDVGIFSSRSIQPGVYRITFEASGFK